MVSRLLYLLSESIRGFFYNRFTTFVVIANMGISLFFIGLFVVAFLNLNRIIDQAQDRITFEVFLEDNAPDIHVLKNEIVHTPGVAAVEYISKEKAYDIFRREVGEDILTAVEGNPLPASFKVRIKKEYRLPGRLTEIRNNLKHIPFVDEVTSLKEWVARLERIRNIFVGISLAAVILLASAIFFMVASTIRMTFLARQDLIKVMELVGASEGMIKIPFYIEGFTKGLLSGFISYGLLIAAFFLLQRLFPDIRLYGQVLTVQVAMGVLLGLMASFRSIEIPENG